VTDSVLWYVTRGAGIASLVMLTGVVVLGIVTSVRWQRPGWPRFLSAELHRSVSLVTLIFLGIHVVVAVIDPYTSLGWASALVPFSSPYRWFWLGLGGVGMYLIAAIVATSLLRPYIGRRTWRLVHWATYAAWPIALVHGMGTGTDTGAPWMWLIDAGCVAAVLAAVAWRVSAADAAQIERDSALPDPFAWRSQR
jgi:methionine sulfoxide reductase heme-binding subunit